MLESAESEPQAE